jgi:hypothetical protein
MPDTPIMTSIHGGRFGISQGAPGSASLVLDGRPVFSGSASVMNYGGVGNGTTDDLTAFNSAFAANNKLTIPPANYRVSQLPNLDQVYLDAGGATITIDDVHQTVTTESKILYADGLTIKGKNTYSTTLSSVSSVTGSIGAWTVTATLADASNIAVGDALFIRDVRPGVKAPGLLSGRPPYAQLDMSYFKMSSGNFTSVGTAGTFSAGDIDAVADVGDLFICNGEVNRIVAINSPTSITLARAFKKDIPAPGIQYYYILRDSSQGTVTVSGTTMTGTGTAFLSVVNRGDMIAVDGGTVGQGKGGVFLVASVDSDTQITLAFASKDVGTASVYGVITPGELHEGVWKVTAKAGNDVTWINTCRSTLGQPPVKSVTLADITVIKTVINCPSGFDGILLRSGQIKLENIAFFGDTTSTTSIGLNMKDDGYASQIVCENVGISEFGYNIWASTGSSIYFENCYSTGAQTRGINVTEGGQIWAETAVSNGNIGFGVFLGPGSYGRLTAARLYGNSVVGLRLEVGASAWCDHFFVCYNGQDGILTVGGQNVHFVGARVNANGDNGIEGQNGIDGRATGFIAWCNNGVGANLIAGKFECSQAQAMGNLQFGVGFNKVKEAIFEFGGSSYNGQAGLYIETSNVDADNVIATGNGTYGVQCIERGSLKATAMAALENVSSDFYVDNYPGSITVVATASGSPTYNKALNGFDAGLTGVHRDITGVMGDIASYVARGANPYLGVYETDAGTDEKDWRWRVNSATYGLYPYSDAGVQGTAPLTFQRSGAGNAVSGMTVAVNMTISTKNIVTDTTTGTKIGTGATQKLGFWNATPVVQPTAVADATDAASVILRLNELLARARTIGIIAT